MPRRLVLRQVYRILLVFCETADQFGSNVNKYRNASQSISEGYILFSLFYNPRYFLKSNAILQAIFWRKILMKEFEGDYHTESKIRQQPRQQRR